MATSTVESTKHTCDRSDCGAEQIVEQGAQPVGYTGIVTHVERDRGGRVVTAERAPWFACKATHIRGAVEAVTATANDSNGDSQSSAPDSGVDGGGEDEPEAVDGSGSGETMVTAASGLQSGERVG